MGSNAAVLTFPTLPISAHYSDVVLRDEGGALAIWHIAINGYTVIALLRFSEPSCNGAVDVAFVESRMAGNGLHVLVCLSSGDYREVDDISFLETIHDIRFDPAISLVSYCRSSEEDRAWVEPASRCCT